MTNDPGQAALFSEDVHDAVKDVIRALGGTKEVGRKLRPELTADSAGHWLKDCLNPERRHRLDPEQLLWLLRAGRDAGCHSLMNYLADEAGYTRPAPLEPLDEAAELQRQFLRGVQQMDTLVRRFERVSALRMVV